MIYKALIILSIVTLISCGQRNNEIDLVVYPEYCGGCVVRNFHTIKNDSLENKFKVYFDTTDKFILEAASLNNLKFKHIDNREIRSRFGDYANIVLFSSETSPIELRTNEIIEKGKHYW